MTNQNKSFPATENGPYTLYPLDVDKWCCRESEGQHTKKYSRFIQYDMGYKVHPSQQKLLFEPCKSASVLHLYLYISMYVDIYIDTPGHFNLEKQHHFESNDNMYPCSFCGFITLNIY